MLDRRSTDFAAHFLRTYPKRTAFMVALLILAGLAEGVGIVTLLPMLEVATGEAAGASSSFARVTVRLLGAVGLPATLGVLLSFIVVVMVIKGGLKWLALRQVGYAVAQVATNLRLQLIQALVKARWSYFTSQPSGHFANAISTEAERTSWAYRRACDALAAFIQLLIYLIVVVLVSWRVALLALGAGGALLYVLQQFVHMSRSAGNRQTRVMKSLVTQLAEVLPNIKPVKAMAREADVWSILQRETKAYNAARRRSVMAEASMQSFREPLFVLLIAVGLYASVAYGGLSFSTVLVLAILFYRSMMAVGKLQSHYQAMTVQESAFHSLQKEIERASEAREEHTGQQASPLLNQELTLDAVSFSYEGGPPVLSDVSLAIPAGHMAAVTGPSGAGKTTLVDLIIGLLRPCEGTVRVDGVPLSRVAPAQWRHLIGYAPQEVLLFHDTIYRNVTLGNEDISRAKIRRALEAAEAWSFVDALPGGIDHVVGERGAKLSGGQRQRISMARALVREPRLLILDEATTALDPATEAAVCQTLRRLRGKLTIIAISHQPALCEAADLTYEVTKQGVRQKTAAAPAPSNAPA